MDLDNHTDFVCGIYFSQFSDAGRRIIQAERRRASDDPWDGSVDRDGGKLDHRASGQKDGAFCGIYGFWRAAGDYPAAVSGRGCHEKGFPVLDGRYDTFGG